MFVEKRRQAVAASAFLALLTLAAFIFLPEDAPWRDAVVFFGVVFAVTRFMTLVRIRFFVCEPEWKDKTWG